MVRAGLGRFGFRECMTGVDGHCHVQKPASQRSGDRNKKEMERERERKRDLVYIRVDTVRLHPTNKLAHECTKIPAAGKPGKSQPAAQPQTRKEPKMLAPRHGANGAWRYPGREMSDVRLRLQVQDAGLGFRGLGFRV